MKMHRIESAYLVAIVLSVVSTLAYGSPFSITRSMQDVDQDSLQDGSDYSQESRETQSNLVLPSKQKSSHPLFIKYVRIVESPAAHVTVTRGHRLELKCRVAGNPPPRIYWIKGENPSKQVEALERESVADASYTAISVEISKLVIECVTPEDEGLIHCVGISGDNIQISSPTVLHVKGNSNGTYENDCIAPTLPVVTRHRPVFISEIGSSIVLPCEATGNPRPHTTWVDGDNSIIEGRKRFTIGADGSLMISEITFSDLDVYKCMVKSKLGSDSARSFVYPAAKVKGQFKRFIELIQRFMP